MVMRLFGRQPECLILEIGMKDARTASRIHGEAFARAWGDGEFESLITQQSVFGFLACPEARARDAALRRYFSKWMKPICQPFRCTAGSISSRSAKDAPIMPVRANRARRRLSCGAIFVSPG